MALVAAYAFSEGSGTTIADFVGSNNLTLASDTIWTASGKTGSAIQGNSTQGSGVSGGGSLAGAGSSTGPLGASAGSFTVSFWLYWAPTAYNQNERFLCLTDASGAVSLSLAQGDSAGWLRSDVFSAGVNVGSGGSPTGYNTSAWHHIAFAVSDTQTKTYIDGTLVDTTAKSAATLDLSGAWSALGAPNNGIYAGANNADRMDDLRFYDHTQTQAEIAADMSVPVGAITANAGPDLTGFTGSPTTLNGGATGGSGTKTYAWSKVSGPSGTFGTPSAATTTFTPAGPGTFTLRLTVTDTSGSSTDDMVLTVTDPTASATVQSVTTATSWTLTPSSGSTSTQILADTSGSTYLTSSNNPTAQVLEVVLQPMVAPSAGVPLVVTLTADALSASSATVSAQLYEGPSSTGTLRSTVSSLTIPAGDGANPVSDTVTVTFPAVDVASVSDWSTGLTLKLSVTAAV